MNTRDNTRDDPAGWLVFRCPGSETGNLEDLLGEMGHKVWTPRVWVSKRVPRRKVRRVVLLAMLPSYLFVSRHADLEELAALGAKHGFWGPMAIRGKRVELKDKDLDGLREADDRVSAPKRWVDPLAPKSPVVVRPLTDRFSGGLVAPAKGSSDPLPPQTPSLATQGASRSPGGGGTDNIPQDIIEVGQMVEVSSGPLAQLGLVALLEEIDGDRACISAFGGRVWMDLAHLTRRRDLG